MTLIWFGQKLRCQMWIFSLVFPSPVVPAFLLLPSTFKLATERGRKKERKRGRKRRRRKNSSREEFRKVAFPPPWLPFPSFPFSAEVAVPVLVPGHRDFPFFVPVLVPGHRDFPFFVCRGPVCRRLRRLCCCCSAAPVFPPPPLSSAAADMPSMWVYISFFSPSSRSLLFFSLIRAVRICSSAGQSGFLFSLCLADISPAFISSVF